MFVDGIGLGKIPEGWDWEEGYGLGDAYGFGKHHKSE